MSEDPSLFYFNNITTLNFIRLSQKLLVKLNELSVVYKPNLLPVFWTVIVLIIRIHEEAAPFRNRDR